MTPVRLAAANVLLSLEERKTTLAAELDEARESIVDPRDRALLVELTAGVLRWQAELDALLTQASQRAIRRIDLRARAVLRLGAYQLRHLDRVPAHAIVNESVDVVRSLGAPKAAGFVNAVLRALIRRGKSLSLPRRPGADSSLEDRLAFLSTSLSHPEWLVRRWLERYGFEATERWCRFNNTTPVVTVRSSGSMPPDELLTRLRDEGLDATPAPFVSDAIRLAPGSLGRISSALRDALVVQDEASQLVARLAGVRRGERVLDVCAAPGGKTLVLASDLAVGDAAAGSLLVAADRRATRVALLASTLGRTDLPVPILALDALEPLPFGAVFDCVLLDAPCSGVGTLRRDPDLKWSRREQDLSRLALDERRMLEMAAAAVRPGGRLVYATCSSEPEENADVVEAFLAADRSFSLTTPASVFPTLVDERGYFRTLPFQHDLDAFFGAVLARRPGT